MKPATAAKKLGVHPDATPDEFRAGVVSRDELDALQADPPEWLRELRRNGPHPRQVVADRLGVSISGRLGRDHRAADHGPDRGVEGGEPEWLPPRAQTPGPSAARGGPTAGERSERRPDDRPG